MKTDMNWFWATVELSDTVGMCIAIYLSWSLNHSLAWAGIHGCFSWLYVWHLVCPV